MEKEHGITQSMEFQKDGVNTIAGWSISKKKEVMPLFEDAVIKLQEKMSKNVANRSKNAAKKL